MAQINGEEKFYTRTLGGSEEAAVGTKPVPSLKDAIPNGGFTAWLQVVGSFFLIFNTW